MRQIEERVTVIAPGAIVRLKKEATSRLTDLMARWRVLGVDEEVIRVEDTEDAEDTRTFYLEHVERVSGGTEIIDSVLEENAIVRTDNDLVWPEHDEWPACIRLDKFASNGFLFDDPETLCNEDEDEDEVGE
jgi:hypothetical protein